MKFTALVQTTTVMIVSATRIGAGSTVTPKSGSEKNCTPWKAMIPAAIIWPAILVSQSSSRMSSIAPTRQTMAAPHSTPPQLAGDEDLAQERQVARGQHRRGEPEEDAPPRRAAGSATLCTSRSRTGVKAPVVTATARRSGVAAYVITAATMRTSRYSLT